MEVFQNISDLAGWPGVFSGVSPYYDRNVARIARLSLVSCKMSLKGEVVSHTR
jgi:hypothetical protein